MPGTPSSICHQSCHSVTHFPQNTVPWLFVFLKFLRESVSFVSGAPSHRGELGWSSKPTPLTPKRGRRVFVLLFAIVLSAVNGNNPDAQGSASRDKDALSSLSLPVPRLLPLPQEEGQGTTASPLITAREQHDAAVTSSSKNKLEKHNSSALHWLLPPVPCYFHKPIFFIFRLWQGQHF